MPKKTLIYFLPVFCWCLLIFVLSHQPKEESEQYSALAIWILKLLGIDLNEWTMGNATLVIRKGAHITEYFILTVLTLRWIRAEWGLTQKRLLLGVLFCVLYAASDEFHQTFISGRVGCTEDVLIDSIGIALAGGLFSLFGQKK